jgi:hypothetical protein
MASNWRILLFCVVSAPLLLTGCSGGSSPAAGPLGTPASHFDAPGHNNALTNQLQQAIIDIQQHKISQAVSMIQHAITRTDGFPLRGGLDGNGPGMDWIIDQNDQNFVYGKLTAALNMLQAM